MQANHIISEIYNSKIRKVILIGDNTNLLDHRYQFIGSFHVVASTSRI